MEIESLMQHDCMHPFLDVIAACPPESNSISNLQALGLPEGTRCINVIWMYPDILSLHGGRGDLMALLRFAIAVKLPLTIKKVVQLADAIPLEDADLLYFCAGDLMCTGDIVSALKPSLPALLAFTQRGGMIITNGSSGAIVAKDLALTDGNVIPGLGLLDMHWFQRRDVLGDDLWIHTPGGMEIIGSQITVADVTLAPHQAPFGRVRYGYGNCGDGFEGAVTDNVLYTGCLGPVLVRNPVLTMELLRRGAQSAGLQTTAEQFVLDPADIAMEEQGLAEARAFIQKKMDKA